MRFEWDNGKNRQNLRKHDIRCETAVLVFEDPNAITQRDSTHDEEEERFVTLGAIGPGSVLFVVHTWPNGMAKKACASLSARAATAREGKSYEDADKRTKTGHRRYRREKEQRYRSF
ncbi:MAG: BrnT family toxin [Acidobacteriaceae bacterium]